MTLEEQYEAVYQQMYDWQAKLMDANFISVYDEVENKFYYYVEKLIGIHVKFLTDHAAGPLPTS